MHDLVVRAIPEQRVRRRDVRQQRLGRAFRGDVHFELGDDVALNLLYQFWIHTELVGKLGWFEWIFNTPSHHRVHHGMNPQYLDRNYGGILIVWDKLFGTFRVTGIDHDPHYLRQARWAAGQLGPNGEVIRSGAGPAARIASGS